MIVYGASLIRGRGTDLFVQRPAYRLDTNSPQGYLSRITRTRRNFGWLTPNRGALTRVSSISRKCIWSEEIFLSRPPPSRSVFTTCQPATWQRTFAMFKYVIISHGAVLNVILSQLFMEKGSWNGYACSILLITQPDFLGQFHGSYPRKQASH